MVPKIIHYIWLGKNPLPKLAEKCIKSWQKFCPDFEIKKWDENNLDINKYQFTKDAYKAKKYAFVSDVMRTEILYKEGGVYLDVDVELIKPIEQILETADCIMGFETSNYLAPGLLLASSPRNNDLQNILSVYSNLNFNINELNKLTICEIYTQYYQTKGLIKENKTQQIDNTIFYSSEYFSPIDVVTNKKKITKNTYSIHWYNSSWYSIKEKLKHNTKKILNYCTFGLFGKLYNKRRINT